MDANPNDVFISYAHIDNKPLIEGQKGWIDRFHYALEARLDQLLGEKTRVWRDEKLRGNDELNDTILFQVKNSTLFVSVFTPRYVKSDSCLQEFKEFCHAAEQPGSVQIPRKSRILKAIKTEVPLEQHPDEVRDQTGYQFYEKKSQGLPPREFVLDQDNERRVQFLLKLDDLAYDIRELLNLIRTSSTNQAGAVTSSSGETIYLAETTPDLTDKRDEIKRELRQRGHIVLPDVPLPRNASDLEKALRSDLQRSKLSIHLIGRNGVDVTEGAEHSIIRVQINLAAACARVRPFRRILWVLPGLKPADSGQEEFLAYLRSEVAGKDGAELIDANIEQLKTIIQDKLSAASKMTELPARNNGKPRIYLMCDKRDLNEVRTVQQHLSLEGFEVILPAMDGQETEVREDHKENLVWCDAALIYYATGNDPWFRTRFRDLDKAFGYGRKKDWLARGVYLAPPRTEVKETVLSNEALVIRAYDSFRPELLDPFVTQLKRPR